MKILVTGYKGFIGQNIVDTLQHDYDIGLFEWGEPFPDFRGFDWCIHLGAISSTTEKNVDLVMERNYDFSRLVLNECQKHGVNLQYASSASVYGLNQEFREESTKNPLSPYAWSKYLFDRFVVGFKGRWTVKVQGFRYFNVHGPHEDHKGSQASPQHQFTKQAKETGIIKLFEGSDNFLRDFVPVETVVDIHRTFLNVDASGIWNVGTGKAKSFEDVAKEIAQEYDAKIEYIPMPENLKNQYQTYTCADLTKLKQYYKL